MWVAAAWLALAFVHTPPALAAFSAHMRKRMYGLDDGGPLGIILIHRGVLFLAVASVCVLAAFSAEARTAALLVTSISVIGFLLAYALHGAPRRLRTIALVDAVALIPLSIVGFDVWTRLSA